jgi:hypothetical protein
VPTKNSERREKSGVLGRVAVVSPACLKVVNSIVSIVLRKNYRRDLKRTKL